MVPVLAHRSARKRIRSAPLPWLPRAKARVDNLALKLVLTPALIGSASLAGRRWGEGLSGWLVGLPFTSAPVALFLALDHGEAFAAATAGGSLTGTAAQAAFCLAYGWLGLRRSWPAALAGGALCFAAAAVTLESLLLPRGLLFAGVVATLAVSIRLLPHISGGTAAASLPSWDLPARMVAATAVVLALTSAAPRLGAELSGLLATFPVYAGILTVFAHYQRGAAAALRVLQGLLFGLFAFAGFFFVLGALIERAGIAASFAVAIVTALSIQGASLWAMKGMSPRS